MDDLLEDYNSLPQSIKDLLAEAEYKIQQQMQCSYKANRELLAKLEKHGYTIDWGLDGEAFGLQKISDSTLSREKRKNPT